MEYFGAQATITGPVVYIHCWFCDEEDPELKLSTPDGSTYYCCKKCNIEFRLPKPLIQ
jgi:hypothetical protein